jgi:hypothetical protein
MIHKNQSIKELPSRQPVQKGRAKAIRSRIEESRTRHHNRQFFLQNHRRKRHLAAQRETYFKAKKEHTLSKNSPKAVKFDRCTSF